MIFSISGIIGTLISGVRNVLTAICKYLCLKKRWTGIARPKGISQMMLWRSVQKRVRGIVLIVTINIIFPD